MRKPSKKFFNSVATIMSYTPTTDSMGGQIRNYIATGVSFFCCFQITNAQESQIMGREGNIVSGRLYCDPSVSIVEQDIFQVDSNNYRVLSVINPNNMNVYKSIDFERVI